MKKSKGKNKESKKLKKEVKELNARLEDLKANHRVAIVTRTDESGIKITGIRSADVGLIFTAGDCDW